MSGSRRRFYDIKNDQEQERGHHVRAEADIFPQSSSMRQTQRPFVPHRPSTNLTCSIITIASPPGISRGKRKKRKKMEEKSVCGDGILCVVSFDGIIFWRHVMSDFLHSFISFCIPYSL
jgi:hypothetical protein